MKKMIKILLIVFICTLGINVANAAEFQEGDTFRINKAEQNVAVDGLEIYSGSTSKGDYKNHIYQLNPTNGGSSVIGYCLDPNSNWGGVYEVTRVLGTDGGPLVRGHDTGLLQIMSLGYNSSNTSGYGVSGDNFYHATNIAMRAFTMGLYNWGESADDSLAKSSAIAKLGAQWAAEYAEYSNIATQNNTIKCINSDDYEACYLGALEKTYAWYDPNAEFKATSETAKSVLAAAKSLFLEGVKAAADYVESGSTVGEITYTIGNAVQDERTEDTVKEHIIIDFTVTNYDEEAEISGFSVNPTTNNAGITIDSLEYSLDGTNYSPLTSDINIIELLEAENGLVSGTFKVRINITKIVNDDCSNMNFTLNYSYKDPNKNMQGARLESQTNANFQRFTTIIDLSGYGGSNDSGSDDGYTEASIPLTVTCANMVCETKVSVPICSDDENEAISEITAPENIKKCILDNVDDALNTYQLSEENGGISNDYCQVFCKEDYKDVIDDGIPGGIKLNPVVEDIECGGFFQLTSHVEGKKDCYTGGQTEDKSINKEKFLQDIQNVQSAMILAQGWKEALGTVTGTQTINDREVSSFEMNYFDVSEGYECGDDGTDTCYDFEYDIDYITITQPIEVDSDDYQVRETQDRYYFYLSEEPDEDGEYPHHGITESNYDTGYTNALKAYQKEATDAINSAMQDQMSEYGLGKVSDYEEAMKIAEEKMTQIIEDYNGCTAAWSMEFPFEQKLKYYYSEYQGEEEFTTYYDMISEAGKEDLNFLEAVEDSLIEESEIEFCTGTTDDEYVCEDGSHIYDGSTEFNIGDYNVINELEGEVYTSRTLTICTEEDGCSDIEIPISDATFVRKTIKKSQDYITPTVYYQTEHNGRITVNSGYTGNALKLDALINSLPVSTKATGGGIFRLMLEDLGEFYDTGELGRLIDFEGDNEESSVAYKLGKDGIETFDGNYVCHYYSPCRPSDCPNCDFVCEGEDCEWVECPNCDFECINCIFNFDELQIIFKPISPSNVTSADREYGYNWDVNTTLAALQLLRDKATVTISEIEEENETIFDKTEGEDAALDFSIRMTADVINSLKAYNDEVEDIGGYANDSLTCYSAEIDGKEYANIFCYSDVIDELIDEYPNQITVSNRTPATGRTDSNANSNNYWELWSDWTEPARDINGQYSVIGGPSWK